MNARRLEVGVLDYFYNKICRYILTAEMYKKIYAELQAGNYEPNEDDVVRHFIEEYKKHQSSNYHFITADSLPINIECTGWTMQ